MTILNKIRKAARYLVNGKNIILTQVFRIFLGLIVVGLILTPIAGIIALCETYGPVVLVIPLGLVMCWTVGLIIHDEL